MDEPLIWGVLPFRHLVAPTTMRWSLGSHDICFKAGYDKLGFDSDAGS
jgi:monolysocardiolipin acyltransferase